MGHRLMRLNRYLPILIAAASLIVAGPAFAAEAGEGAQHAERGLIDFKWQEAVYTIVVFAIFFGVLSTVVWPKILTSLQAREDKMRGDLRHAEDAAKQASATLEEYKQQLADAQKQAQQIVEESRMSAQKVAAQL
ncbi:MAG: ATP synthase F0 subunit B, partial [Planctomycetota bacterium]